MSLRKNSGLRAIWFFRGPTCVPKNLGPVHEIGVNLDEGQPVRIGGPCQSVLKFPFGANVKSNSSSEYLHEFVVMPRLDITVESIACHTFDDISIVID